MSILAFINSVGLRQKIEPWLDEVYLCEQNILSREEKKFNIKEESVPEVLWALRDIYVNSLRSEPQRCAEEEQGDWKREYFVKREGTVGQEVASTETESSVAFDSIEQELFSTLHGYSANKYPNQPLGGRHPFPHVIPESTKFPLYAAETHAGYELENYTTRSEGENQKVGAIAHGKPRARTDPFAQRISPLLEFDRQQMVEGFIRRAQISTGKPVLQNLSHPKTRVEIARSCKREGSQYHVNTADTHHHPIEENTVDKSQKFGNTTASFIFPSLPCVTWLPDMMRLDTFEPQLIHSSKSLRPDTPNSRLAWNYKVLLPPNLDLKTTNTSSNSPIQTREGTQKMMAKDSPFKQLWH